MSKLPADLLTRLQTPLWKRRPEVLLCPQVPKPMHGLAPRMLLGKEWWDRTRRAAYASTGFHCVACGVHKSEAREHRWLEGHELYETDYLAGRMTYVETVPLCHFCHSFIHSGRLEMLVRAGKETHRKLLEVRRHGLDVLADAKLLKDLPYQGPCAEWGSWRLVLDGKEHPPIHATFEEWLAFYQGSTEDA